VSVSPVVKKPAEKRAFFMGIGCKNKSPPKRAFTNQPGTYEADRFPLSFTPLLDVEEG
jgi:hypothetical protein